MDYFQTMVLTNGLLSKEKHGFMPGRSCVTQLLTVLTCKVVLLYSKMEFQLMWHTWILPRHLTWSPTNVF